MKKTTSASMHRLTVNLSEYIKKDITIPCYQRGYIWGKEHGKNKRNAVSSMLDSLLDGYAGQSDIFIQGMTVIASDKSLKVIDGQQRTTFFYLLLKAMGDRGFNLSYESARGADGETRLSPQQWLEAVNEETDCEENAQEEFQDIYYFKKTIRLIRKHGIYRQEPRASLLEYIKEHVFFLLIPITGDIAVKTFTMMNGSKAEMEGHELIKADLLRKASMDTGECEGGASEWDNLSLRSRYAREWDKWRYWWNREEVRRMFHCSRPMGWLLPCALKQSDDSLLYQSYTVYMDKYLCGKNEHQKAKIFFNTLRLLQNKFYEIFNDTTLHNQFGIITHILDKNYIIIFINNYFSGLPSLKEMKTVYDLLLCGMTYHEIANIDMAAFEEKKNTLQNNLVNNPVYSVNNELAYKYLLIRNVEADRRRFDFTIWDGNRSLEHIYPKSKVVHKQEGQWVRHDAAPVACLDGLKYRQRIWVDDREGMPAKREGLEEYLPTDAIKEAAMKYDELKDMDITEDSIGNLLLLYKNNNSEFKNKLPEIKRRDDFFDTGKPLFESRNLLHTLMSFGRYEHFGAEQICENQQEVLDDIKQRLDALNIFMENNRK